MTGGNDQVVAQWVESTGCGTRYETLTADGQVHVQVAPPWGEARFEGDGDPDYNPVCCCPRAPQAWCAECGGCADCWKCTHRPGLLSR
ncbi:hypothetical protein [Actinacidiphila oryziradicis]|uniref:Uncharacterized protein n=1 Tax=Actinacidiphila oryziradicis TaxID=2571141 RepID=A0A4U0RI46_9ACTN|nr:hypothetical protein [Actinacidiphila oryziradicis]TJZ95309.1 hypothetical protein FCI23_52355 [Actinacidiphila oryziradicis]